MLTEVNTFDRTESISRKINAAALNMFERVLSHACSEIAAVLHRNRVDEDIERKRKLKKTVRFLREEKKKARHRDCILDVTDNGKNLIIDPIIESKDCLELVMEYVAW